MLILVRNEGLSHLEKDNVCGNPGTKKRDGEGAERAVRVAEGLEVHHGVEGQLRDLVARLRRGAALEAVLHEQAGC